ncbi:ribonucleotide-diphosphate reductase subunit beta [Klebsiella michiganensis]|nr:ribonucleotide-diphosphate reductase subunit beta [Klebsiella michiganensis]
MAYTTFSQTKNDQLKEPMFFGQPVNVARYDQQKYDIFEKLIEKQLSFFWRPEEVDVSRRPYRLSGAAGTRKNTFFQQPENIRRCWTPSRAAARTSPCCR